MELLFRMEQATTVLIPNMKNWHSAIVLLTRPELAQTLISMVWMRITRLPLSPWKIAGFPMEKREVMSIKSLTWQLKITMWEGREWQSAAKRNLPRRGLAQLTMIGQKIRRQYLLCLRTVNWQQRQGRS